MITINYISRMSEIGSTRCGNSDINMGVRMANETDNRGLMKLHYFWITDEYHKDFYLRNW